MRLGVALLALVLGLGVSFLLTKQAWWVRVPVVFAVIYTTLVVVR
jgi:hypothetical protein